LLTASHDGTVRVWDLASGKTIHVLRHEAKLLDEASYSPDGRHILVKSRAGLGVWDASTAERRFVFKGHDVLPLDARFAPDGGSVLSSDMKGRVVQWAIDGSSTRELRSAGASAGSSLVYGIEMSPDGRTLVLPGAESQVLELPSLRPRFALRDSAVALSPDGQKLLVQRDGVLRVLEVAGGKELSVLAGSHAQASTMSFSPDGRLLLVVSRETEAGLFDVASGRLLRKLAIDEKSVIQGAEFSADGSSIVVLSGERTLRRFPCHECRPVDQLIKDAKRRIARDLTPEERRSVGLP
jgi:WD40 repeat protein